MFHNEAGSYNQPVSKRRLTFAAALAARRAGGVSPAGADAVARRGAETVGGLRRRIPQAAVGDRRRGNLSAGDRRHRRASATRQPVNPPRTLKSDLLLVKPADADRYVELRDVFEVDGKPVRDRAVAARAAAARSDRPRRRAASATIIAESARYNIGSIQRNINTPLMALHFLDAVNQQRFQFQARREAASRSSRTRADAAINDAPVFRVSTEMWTIEYRGARRATPSSARPTASNLPGARTLLDRPVERQRADQRADRRRRRRDRDGDGQLPVGAADGIPRAGRNARVVHPRSGERISGRAEYGKFRQIRK